MCNLRGWIGKNFWKAFLLILAALGLALLYLWIKDFS